MAPNSLTARAHITTAAAVSPRADSGSVTRRNARHASSPSVRATDSNRASTRANASRAALTYNGADTNSMAQTIPVAELATRSPAS